MMQRMKLYEQPTLNVLILQEDAVTTSGLERDYDKGENDIFVPAGSN